jgi:hypothetical protein
MTNHILSNKGPIYPLDTSEIPTDTTAHLKATRRESPLVTAEIAESFGQSKSFKLRIQSILTDGSKHDLYTVYRCEITSIDDNPVSSPSLCLKLFDDRFQPLPSPIGDVEDLDVPRWFDTVIFAEVYALDEAFAYDKLRPVQGSVVPWFYSTYQVKCSCFVISKRLLINLLQ